MISKLVVDRIAGSPDVNERSRKKMGNQAREIEPLAYSIADACKIISIGRTRLYELLSDGTIQSVRVGRRRLVKADSIRALVNQAA